MKVINLILATMLALIAVDALAMKRVLDSNDTEMDVETAGELDGLPLVKTLERKSDNEIILSLAITPDNSLIITGGYSRLRSMWDLTGNIAVWDKESGRLLQTLGSPGKLVSAVAISSLGTEILAGSDDGKIKMWDFQNNCLPNQVWGYDGIVLSIATSSNGRYIATGSANNTVKVWDDTLMSTTCEFDSHRAPVHTVKISGDNQYLISGSADGTMITRELVSGLHKCSLLDIDRKNGRRSTGFFALTHDDEDLIYSLCSQDGVNSCQIRVDNFKSLLASPKQEPPYYTIEGPVGVVGPLAVTRNKKYLVAGSRSGEIHIFDLATKTHRKSFNAHQKCISSIAISPDDRHLFSVSFDGTGKIWDLSSLKNSN